MTTLFGMYSGSRTKGSPDLRRKPDWISLLLRRQELQVARAWRLFDIPNGHLKVNVAQADGEALCRPKPGDGFGGAH